MIDKIVPENIESALKLNFLSHGTLESKDLEYSQENSTRSFLVVML